MLDTFSATLSPMLIMFSALFIGFILSKFKLLPDDAGSVIAKLENYVFVPALTFSTFNSYCTIESLGENIQLVLYSVLALIFAILLAIPLSWFFDHRDPYKRNIYKYALIMGNYGYMGNAIVPIVLGGQQHLFCYLLFTLPLSVFVYIWGIAMLTPKEYRSGNALKGLLNPVCISMVLGILCGILKVGQYFPVFLTTTINNLSACMGPLAMLLTGIVIGTYPLKSMFTNKKVYWATLLRLFVLGFLIFGFLKICGAPDYVVILSLFAYATPLGMNTVVFPAAFGGDTKLGASMAMISHTLCIFSIPIVYALLKFILSIF